MSNSFHVGTLNTVAAKIQNETPSLGNDGTVHKFHHPWYYISDFKLILSRVQTWLMFMGEILCLFYFGAQLCCCKKEDEDIKVCQPNFTFLTVSVKI